MFTHAAIERLLADILSRLETVEEVASCHEEVLGALLDEVGLVVVTSAPLAAVFPGADPLPGL